MTAPAAQQAVATEGWRANTQSLRKLDAKRYEAGLQPNTHQPAGCRANAMPTMPSTTASAAMKNTRR